MRRWFALAGFALLAAMIAKIGPAQLLAHASGLRWALPVLCGLGFLRLLLRTLSWSLALRAEGISISFRDLLAARFAAQSAGYLALGGVVSEGINPMLLSRWTSVELSVAASAAETKMHWTASTAAGLAGILAGLLFFGGRPAGVAAGFIAAAGLYAGGLALLLTSTQLTSKAGLLVARRMGPGHRWCNMIRRAEPVELSMRSFNRRHPAAALRMLALSLLVQLTLLADVAVVMRAAGIAAGFITLLALESSIRAVKILSFYIPGRIGADEAGAASAFALFGFLPAAGFTLALSRRLQGLSLATAGLAWVLWDTRRNSRKEKIDASSAIAARIS